MNAAEAVGLHLQLTDARPQWTQTGAEEAVNTETPEKVRVGDYPLLSAAAWQLDADSRQLEADRQAVAAREAAVAGRELVVDAKALPLVEGTRIDYAREGMNAAFVFHNPNATGECGCGESFTVAANG